MGKTCRVSFKDIDGISHAVQVEAETMYEAAVLGLNALKRSDWIEVIGPGTRIVIQVHEPPVEHFIMFAQLTRYLDGGATNPAELVKKKRLKALLAS
ncbi:MAG TPA: hypothetical protein VMZ90_06600 [Vicinamibacterales bacterium]|nr:hypothetical protein [Vicinamibacterales bacterium]